MSDQLHLEFDPLTRDPVAARVEAERGMGLADQAERVQEWKRSAALWFVGLSRGGTFTADDLTAAIGLPDVGPNRNNIVGAWFNGQAQRGLIVWTHQFCKSERVVRHGNQQRIWRKL